MTNNFREYLLTNNVAHTENCSLRTAVIWNNPLSILNIFCSQWNIIVGAHFVCCRDWVLCCIFWSCFVTAPIWEKTVAYFLTHGVFTYNFLYYYLIMHALWLWQSTLLNIQRRIFGAELQQLAGYAQLVYYYAVINCCNWTSCSCWWRIAYCWATVAV